MAKAPPRPRLTPLQNIKFQPVEGPPRPRMVMVGIPLDEAERLSAGLSDILCWCRGWMARAGDDTSHAPMGTEEVRELNIRLKRAIEAKP